MAETPQRKPARRADAFVAAELLPSLVQVKPCGNSTDHLQPEFLSTVDPVQNVSWGLKFFQHALAEVTSQPQQPRFNRFLRQARLSGQFFYWGSVNVFVFDQSAIIRLEFLQALFKNRV